MYDMTLSRKKRSVRRGLSQSPTSPLNGSSLHHHAGSSTKLTMNDEQAPPADTGASAPPAMSEAELRSKLRPIFDRFDIDASGAVNAAELSTICAQVNLEMSAAQIQTMVSEADPDGSGDINFDEFVAALQRQMAAGGGDGLAAAFSQASVSFFGALNPLSWFGLSAAPAPAASASREKTRSSPVSARARSRGEARSPVRSYGGGSWWLKGGFGSIGASFTSSSPRARASDGVASRARTRESPRSRSPRSPGRAPGLPAHLRTAVAEASMSTVQRQYYDKYHEWYYKQFEEEVCACSRAFHRLGGLPPQQPPSMMTSLTSSAHP